MVTHSFVHEIMTCWSEPPTLCETLFPAASWWCKRRGEVPLKPHWPQRQPQCDGWSFGVRWLDCSFWAWWACQARQMVSWNHLPYTSWGSLCRRDFLPQSVLDGKRKQGEDPRVPQFQKCLGWFAGLCNSCCDAGIFCLHPSCRRHACDQASSAGAVDSEERWVQRRGCPLS